MVTLSTTADTNDKMTNFIASATFAAYICKINETYYISTNEIFRVTETDWTTLDIDGDDDDDDVVAVVVA